MLVYFCIPFRGGIPVYTLVYPCTPLYTPVCPYIPRYALVNTIISLPTLVYPRIPLFTPSKFRKGVVYSMLPIVRCVSYFCPNFE